MATTKSISLETTRSSWTAILSLIIPGSGQLLLKRRWRGILILLTAVSLTLLINWSQGILKIGLFNIAGLKLTWLWIPFILFWGWNVFDTVELANNRRPNPLPMVILSAIILYVIAWNVTNVRLDRLVSRFGDAVKVGSNLINPDMITISVNGEDQVCAWTCLGDYAAARLEGKPPAGPIRISDNLLDIVGRVKIQPVPRWQVKLGLVPEGTQAKTFVAGSLVETIAIGLMATIFSTILAIPVSFLAAHNIMSRVRGGSAIYYFFRTFLNIVRAVDPVVWGLLVIIWVGLGSFAGVIALTIQSISALGKLL